MSLPVVLSVEAEADLDEIAQWYDQQAGLGADLLAEVRTVLARIETFPEMYAVEYRDVRRGLVKRFPYSVFYRVHADRVEVLSVFDNRRNPSIWRRRIQ